MEATLAPGQSRPVFPIHQQHTVMAAGLNGRTETLKQHVSTHPSQRMGLGTSTGLPLQLPPPLKLSPWVSTLLSHRRRITSLHGVDPIYWVPSLVSRCKIVFVFTCLDTADPKTPHVAPQPTMRSGTSGSLLPPSPAAVRGYPVSAIATGSPSSS